mmetsp:Transcript_9171/g.41774  ORF Transcript_9171/g.41774 Transcript_9171/m.41774 type:complete len:109 (-) Transcript_9171:977-1303(-)
MPRYYCDYCDAHLTHDSPSVRKQHNAGYKHKVRNVKDDTRILQAHACHFQANVRNYYMQFEEQTTQSILATRAQEDTFFQHLSDSQAAFNTQVNQTIKKQMDRYMTGH